MANVHRWQDRFRRESATGLEWPRRATAAPVRLVPVQLIADPERARGASALTLVFAGGVRLEVVPGFDASTLQQVVQVPRGGGMSG